VFGNEPGVRKIEIYQAGSSQHKLQLCVTNVMVHGPGVKLLDGLAEAKHQWGCDLHLPLPPLSYHNPGLLCGAAPQFLPVIGLDAGQLGYSSVDSACASQSAFAEATAILCCKVQTLPSRIFRDFTSGLRDPNFETAPFP